VVIIQKYVRKWLVRCAYLKFLSITTSIQCCWRKVLAIREFRRLKQEAIEVATNHIQDSRANLLEEGGMIWFSLVIRPKQDQIRILA
jgi:hypothetical protein